MVSARRVLVLAAAAAALAAACGDGGGDAGADGAERPNVVLLVMDTLRRDRLGAYGNPDGLTPNLDELAAEAAVFEDALAQSTATAPGHRSLLTGQFVHRHGQIDNGQPWSSPYDLAKLLRSAGYRTAAFVGGGPLADVSGFQEGFDRYEDLYEYDDARAHGEHMMSRSGELDEAVDRALRWLDEGAEEPFLLFVHGFDPHCPYWPAEDLREKRAGWYEGPLDPRGRCGGVGFDPLFAEGAIGPDELAYLHDLYDAGVEQGDRALGRLLDALRGRGLLDRSIVVFTSDHGESLGERDVVGHTLLWEEQMEIPLVVRFPEGRYAGRYDDPVQHVDVLPTLLSALDLRIPPAVQGVDLLPRLRGGEPLGRERLRIVRYQEKESVRFDDRWKLSFRWTPSGVVDGRLYDLREDPAETRDLAATPEGRRRYETLLERYLAWRALTRDDDRRWRGEPHGEGLEPEHRAALEALGYVDGG